MSDTPGNGSTRLDSWKAIAGYLDRDERTAQRWERELGLPVRRFPGGRGRSVFAYSSEIDAWLLSARAAGGALAAEAPASTDPSPTSTPSHTPAPVAVARRPHAAGWRYAAAVLALVAAAAGWRWRPSTVAASELRVRATTDGVEAFDLQGAKRWSYRFAPAFRTFLAEQMADPVRVPDGDPPAIFVATAHQLKRLDESQQSGTLIELSPDGRVRQTFTFTDEVTFDGTTYGPPWVVTTYAINETAGARRIAIAAHHAVWDASLVTVLDEKMERHGTFAHAGWVEQLEWAASNRLVIGGFSNAHDGGMVALLDPTAPGGIDGQGPEVAGSHHFCSTCPAGLPLGMVIMPRTELNRVTASRFNRARLQIASGRILARTIEVPAAGLDAVDALYELTPSLDLLRASYGNHYWETHRNLEAIGTLHRTREQSPDRDGPREIQRWTPQAGWQTIHIR
ncbi:MAG: hypothetical protein JWL71_3256 [Acidobacteria bacterium]|nr:hypothetical protein [Acidobacteriota bacterium]